MKRICISRSSLLLCVMLLIVSCKSQSKVVLSDNIKSEHNESIESVSSEKGRSESNKNTLTLFDLSDEYELNKIEIEYDPTLPIDSATGNHPVKKRTETNLTKKSKDNSVKSESEQNIIDGSRQSEINSSLSEAAVLQHSESTEKKTEREIDIVLRWAGVTALLIVLLYIIFYIVRRQRKKLL